MRTLSVLWRFLRVRFWHLCCLPPSFLEPDFYIHFSPCLCYTVTTCIFSTARVWASQGLGCRVSTHTPPFLCLSCPGTVSPWVASVGAWLAWEWSWDWVWHWRTMGQSWGCPLRNFQSTLLPLLKVSGGVQVVCHMIIKLYGVYERSDHLTSALLWDIFLFLVKATCELTSVSYGSKHMPQSLSYVPLCV